MGDRGSYEATCRGGGRARGTRRRANRPVRGEAGRWRCLRSAVTAAPSDGHAQTTWLLVAPAALPESLADRAVPMVAVMLRPGEIVVTRSSAAEPTVVLAESELVVA